MKLFLVSFILDEHDVDNANEHGEAITSIHTKLNTIFPNVAVIKVGVINDVPEDKASERTIALLAK